MKLFRRLRYICKSFRFFFNIVYRPITGPVPGEEPWLLRKRWAIRMKPKQAWLIVKLGWQAWEINDELERMIQQNRRAALHQKRISTRPGPA